MGFIPAAGNYDGSKRYNAGENGNVWSASLNSNNPNNAFNLNFNSDEVNVNNNDRYNGLPVRGVQHSPSKHIFIKMTLTLDQLILDLYHAERIARKHKTSKWYVRLFEQNLDENIRQLAIELYNQIHKLL